MLPRQPMVCCGTLFSLMLMCLFCHITQWMLSAVSAGRFVRLLSGMSPLPQRQQLAARYRARAANARRPESERRPQLFCNGLQITITRRMLALGWTLMLIWVLLFCYLCALAVTSKQRGFQMEDSADHDLVGCQPARTFSLGAFRAIDPSGHLVSCLCRQGRNTCASAGSLKCATIHMPQLSTSQSAERQPQRIRSLGFTLFNNTSCIVD